MGKRGLWKGSVTTVGGVQVMRITDLSGNILMERVMRAFSSSDDETNQERPTVEEESVAEPKEEKETEYGSKDIDVPEFIKKWSKQKREKRKGFFGLNF